jgi:hypothetical protein
LPAKTKRKGTWASPKMFQVPAKGEWSFDYFRNYSNEDGFLALENRWKWRMRTMRQSP